MDRKEAIEVIKKNYPHVGISGSEFESALRELVPELKESEDERMRKMLIEIVNITPAALAIENRSELLAYLEKQKEQKHSISGLFWKNHDDYFEDEIGMPTLLKDEALILCNGKYSLGFSIMSGDKYILLKDIEAAITQKPAEWSEEDKRMLNVAIKSCEQTIEDYPNDKVRFKDCIDWLKSLRPKPHWKPDVEDYKALNRAIDMADELGETKTCEILKGLRIELKSIHPFSWKPSEEQISALEYFIRSWGESGTMSPQNPTLCAANSLLHDLKSL